MAVPSEHLRNLWICIILGFRREVGEICTLLGCYAAYGGNSLSAFRDNLLGPSSRVKKSKNVEFLDPSRLYQPVVRNFGKELPLYGADRRSRTAGFHEVRINLSCFYGGGCGKLQKQLIVANLTMRYFSQNLKILHRAPFSRERNEIQFTSGKSTGHICCHEF